VITALVAAHEAKVSGQLGDRIAGIQEGVIYETLAVLRDFRTRTGKMNA
jgi:hypothetical protein